MTVQPVGARCTEHGSHTFFAAFFFLNEFRTQNRRLETRHITDTEVGKQQQETLRHTSQGTEETTVAHTTRCWPSLPGGERRARPHKPPHPSHLKRKKKSTHKMHMPLSPLLSPRQDVLSQLRQNVMSLKRNEYSHPHADLYFVLAPPPLLPSTSFHLPKKKKERTHIAGHAYCYTCRIVQVCVVCLYCSIYTHPQP